LDIVSFTVDGVEQAWLEGVKDYTAAPENGNVKFTIKPKMENGEKPDSFFFRVKMK
jgi:hypothetical protein